MDNQSLSHSRYNCTYHIVFIPKYRRKVVFGALRKEVGEAISKVWTWHDDGKNIPNITNKIAKWIVDNGWNLPKK